MVVGEETAAALTIPAAPVSDPRLALLQAGVQMLEALAEMVANGTLVASLQDGGDGEATRDLLRRGALALQSVVRGLAGPGAKGKGAEAKKET